MKRYKLTVEKRSVFGKKLKKLRKEGFLPGNIYGKDVKSTAVQLPYKEFEEVFKDAGETGVVDVQLDSETRPVLIHNVQLDHMTSTPLHADFFQVNLKEKVKTMVQLVITGEPKAVTDKVGLLLQPLSEVEVEALPTDLPEHIEVDVTHLAAVDEQIAIKDLKIPTGVAILTDPEQTVVKIAELVTKEAQEESAKEAAAAEAAKAETAEAEGEEAPLEGEKPETTEEKKPEETSKETPQAKQE